MNVEKIWRLVESFASLIGIIAGLIAIVPVLIAFAQGTAVIPFWEVLIIAISAILLGYISGRMKAPKWPLGIRKMWSERRYVPAETWNSFTAAAQSEVWLFGVAEVGFADDQKFHKIVVKGCERGCNYRFLLLDPSSATARRLDAKEGGEQQVQGRIRHALDLFQCMQRQNIGKRGKVEIRLYHCVPHVSIVRSDKELLITQYMWSRVGNGCYTYLVEDVPEGVFQQYTEYFEAMWENAKTIPA